MSRRCHAAGPFCRYQLSAIQSGLVVSLSLAGALLGSLLAFFFGDRLGRKKELTYAAGLYGAAPCPLALPSSMSAALPVLPVLPALPALHCCTCRARGMMQASSVLGSAVCLRFEVGRPRPAASI